MVVSGCAITRILSGGIYSMHGFSMRRENIFVFQRLICLEIFGFPTNFFLFSLPDTWSSLQETIGAKPMLRQPKRNSKRSADGTFQLTPIFFWQQALEKFPTLIKRMPSLSTSAVILTLYVSLTLSVAADLYGTSRLPWMSLTERSSARSILPLVVTEFLLEFTRRMVRLILLNSLNSGEASSS